MSICLLSGYYTGFGGRDAGAKATTMSFLPKDLFLASKIRPPESNTEWYREIQRKRCKHQCIKNILAEDLIVNISYIHDYKGKFCPPKHAKPIITDSTKLKLPVYRAANAAEIT